MIAGLLIAACISVAIDRLPLAGLFAACVIIIAIST